MPLAYKKQPVKAVVNDVTVSRALENVYTNNTGRPLLVILTVVCDLGTTGTTAVCVGRTGGFAIAEVGLPVGSLAKIMRLCLVWAVPNGWEYDTFVSTDGDGSVTLEHWIEVEL